MGLLDWFESRWKSESKMYKYAQIPGANVVSAGEGPKSPEPFAAGDHYFRLWLVEMFLANDRKWFTEWHPAVHAAVRFNFGDKEELITRVAGASLLPDLSNEKLNRVVSLNYALTPLMPFNGGTIELSAGLLAIAGRNDVKSFLKVLGDFSNLLMVPQLTAALAIATPLANGLSELVGATENQLMLGLHQTWTAGTGGAASLRAGYFAVILSDDSKFADDKLWVDNGRLKHGDTSASAKPLTGLNYMLFRLERRDERDDWDSLKAIQDPYDKAIEMLRVGNTEQADAYIRSAKAAAFLANELTRNVDQRRVVLQIQKSYEEAKEQLGFEAFPSTGVPSLGDLMLGAMPIAAAKSLGSLRPEDVGLEGLSVPALDKPKFEPKPKSSKPRFRGRGFEETLGDPPGGGGFEAVPRGGSGWDTASGPPDPPDVGGEWERGSRSYDPSPGGGSFEGLEGFESVEGPAPRSQQTTTAEPPSSGYEAAAQAEQFYFALEGDKAKGNAVEYGSDVDLIFNYARVEREVIAVLEGGGLELARTTSADLGITVIPRGFTFREEDPKWYKVARFRGGRMEEPVRFKLRAASEDLTAKTVDPQPASKDAPPRLKTGVQIIFELDGVTLYQFALAIRLVRSIADVEKSKRPGPPIVLNLDKSVERAQKARRLIEEATEMPSQFGPADSDDKPGSATL